MSKHAQSLIIYGIVLLLTALLLATGLDSYSRFISLAEAGVAYCKAEVTAADNSEMTRQPTPDARLYGNQYVTMVLLSGEHKGETVMAQTFVTADSYLFVEEGDRIIASVTPREEGQIYCRVVSFYRLPGIVFLIAVFIIGTVLIYRRKGLRALVGLAFTLLSIICFTIPQIYFGASPILCAIVTGAGTSAVTLLLLNGFHRKTLAATLSTCAGFGIAGLLFAGFSLLGNVTGYNSQQLGMLSYFSVRTELDVKHILFAGVLIASLGAVMDVSMSVSSAVYEIHNADPSLRIRKLFRAGMEVAKDTIGTMVNTLILAFTGGSLAALIALTGYGIQFNRFLNSDFIAIEIGQGLSASAALVLMAPLTALTASALLANRKNT
ncbi:MAG: YibE/F family protein [Oscillospiraceae bacterium]|jgi:uncharacterized membrane protein|nr:YibE/F family protein [Oscillospiraceae bacterium]